MPKYRQLHVKIIDSFDFAEMPDDFTRVVWMLLTIIVDSEGRGIYNMAWVKSKMFPLRQDVTTERLQDAFEWLSNRKMISVYCVNDRDYFYIPTFKKYQSGTMKEAKSNIPEPSIGNSGVGTEELQSKVKEKEEEVSAAVLYCIDLGSVFKTYEKEIGILTPAVRDAINDAEKEYTPALMIEAMQAASKQNVRTWAYTMGILKHWNREGKGNGHKPNPKDPRDQGLSRYDNI